MKLKGKRALVTGATRGIGLAVAEALVREGVQTVLCSRSESDVRSTAASLSGETSAFGFSCDVGDPDGVRAMLEFCEEQLGGLEILINNAAIGIFKRVEELSVAEWQSTIKTNLDSLFYCCRYALPLMKKAGEGFIINIGSLAGKNAFPTAAAYNASKFGLTGFSEALMQEVRHDDIQVAYLMPGSVDTWFGGKAPQGESSWKIAPEDVAAVVVETLKRNPRCLTSRIEMRPSKPPAK